MTFPILGGNGAVAGAFSIDNSLRFNGSVTADYLSRTPSSASNRQTWTFSAWFKHSKTNTRTFALSGGEGNQYGNDFSIEWGNDGRLWAYNYATTVITTSATFRDVSAWYHLVFAVDTTQSTDSNRIKVYINGEQITSFATTNYPSQNDNTGINTTHAQYIGTSRGYLNYDGYMAEVHLIDGSQKAPTDFGEFDEDSGIWKPIRYSGSYGTNGYKLNFSDSGSLGADSSGNGNNFTATNLASTDQTTDTPTNNFCTLNSIYINGASSNIAPTYSEGNTITNSGGSGTSATRTSSTFEFSSGKWYWEVKVNDSPSAVDIGINNNTIGALCGIRQDGTYFTDNNNQGTLTSFTSGDIISFAFDMDNKKMYIAKNGTYMNSANPSTSTNGISFTTTDSMHCQFKSRQDDSLSANFGNPPFSITSGNSDDNGYGNFEYAPPSGYLALCTQNLATALSPTIDDGSQYFNTVLYTGNGSSQSITGVGFSPDFLWLKERSSTSHHQLFHDADGGVPKFMQSSTTIAEVQNSAVVSSFDSDGFSVGSSGGSNQSGETYVGWNWYTGASYGSNTDGSITSTVSANTTAGFSIVTYTGNRTAGATVGHGLGVAPSMVIAKCRTASAGWPVFHASLGGSNFVRLNETSASASNSVMWNNTAPSSTVVTLGGGDETNNDTGGSIMYCFAEIEGYSKFGSYTGNGSSDGTFVPLSFKPAWVLIKTNNATDYWTIFDTTRKTFNIIDNRIHPNVSDAEYSGDGYGIDMLSNGFKQRSTAGAFNGSGRTYIYYAIAENPFATSGGVSVTAR
jgi:hypothetical protein